MLEIRNGKKGKEFKCPGCDTFGPVTEAQLEGAEAYVCRNPACSFSATFPIRERVAAQGAPGTPE